MIDITKKNYKLAHQENVVFVPIAEHKQALRDGQTRIETLEEEISNSAESREILLEKLRDSEDYLTYYKTKCSRLQADLSDANHEIYELNQRLKNMVKSDD